MADNDILGKPQEGRGPGDKVQRIDAARMSRKYDSLEFDVDGAQSGYTSLKDVADGPVAGATVSNKTGNAFSKHPRAHAIKIRVTGAVRFRFNDAANDIITVGSTGNTYDENTIELSDVFFEAQEAARIEVVLS